MGQSRRLQRQLRFVVPLVLAGLGALALCLAATVGAATSPLNPTDAVALAANATGGVPAGGVLGDVTGDGIDDILAIDPAGRLWLYPGSGSTDQNMFAGDRSQVGSGWTGYTLAAVAELPQYGITMYGARAGLVAIDPAGRLWYYPNTGLTGTQTFETRYGMGRGWTGYTVVGVTNLYGIEGAGTPGILAIDPAGKLWYYPPTGGTGGATFGARTEIGPGWTGYTALVRANSGTGPDLLAVDPAGNLLLYPNTGLIGTFGAPTQISSGWSGWQAIDLGQMAIPNAAVAGIGLLAIDPAGNLWYYPETGITFGPPVQVGTGWTGYRIN